MDSSNEVNGEVNPLNPLLESVDRIRARIC